MRYAEIVEAAPPTEAGGYGGSGQAPSGNNSSWGPFKSAANYGANMAVVMGTLFSAFVLGLLLMAAARFLFRRLRRAPPDGHPGKAVAAAISAGGAGSPTVYAAGETELAGSAAVCAICLSEFADGEAVRVMPPCRHGFHAECVEAWWTSSAAAAPAKPLHRSAPPCCPVCRAIIICQSSPAPETEHRGGPRS